MHALGLRSGGAAQVQRSHARQRVHLEVRKQSFGVRTVNVSLPPPCDVHDNDTNDCGSYSTCTGEMASKLLVLGTRPFGITPGGGCLALFITLLQLATMVRIVSESSWDTLLQESSEKQHRHTQQTLVMTNR